MKNFTNLTKETKIDVCVTALVTTLVATASVLYMINMLGA